MIRRSLLLAALALVVVAAPASAQYEEPAAGATVLSEDTVRVSGQGCPPGGDVNGVAQPGGATGSDVADDNGAYSMDINVGGPGQYEITITCGAVTQVLGVTVAADGTGTATAGLPRTGDDSSLPLARIGILLVALGGLAVYGARKRHHHRVDATV